VTDGEIYRCAQEFLQEYPAFIQQRHPLDNFAERLSKNKTPTNFASE
jgi:hypothetical protein